MRVRKCTPDEAAQWGGSDEAQVSAEMLRDRLADRRGITRIDTHGAAGGEHAWRARVYTAGGELHRQFADRAYGGPLGALEAAVAWRECTRAAVGPRPPRRGQTVRVVRAEYARMCGWLAYAATTRRYFADGAHGGRMASYATARAWLAAQEA